MSDIDRADYESMLGEFGLTEPDMRKLATLPYNVIEVGRLSKVVVGDSPIDRQGLFAAQSIAPGEVIAMATLGRSITPAGRYANHARHPNARMCVTNGGDLFQVSLRAIKEGQEITNDYRHNARTMYACIAACRVDEVTAEMVRDAMHAALARVQAMDPISESAVQVTVRAALAGGVH